MTSENSKNAIPIGRFFCRSTINVIASIIQVGSDAIMVIFVYAIAMRHCETAEIGLWAFILAWMTFSRISDVFISPVVVRFTAIAMSDRDRKQAAMILIGGMRRVAFRVGTTSLLISCSLIFYANFGIEAAEFSIFFRLALCAWAYVVLVALSGAVSASLDGLARTDLRSTTAILANFVRIFITAWLIKSQGIAGFAVGMVMQSLTSLMIGAIFITRELRGNGVSMFGTHNHWTPEMLAFGKSYQAAGICQMFLEPSTRVVFPFFASFDSLGQFDIASKFITQVRAAVVAPLGLLLPLFSSSKNLPLEKMRCSYLKYSRLAFFLTSGCFSVLVGLLPALSLLWLGGYQENFVVFGSVLACSWAVNAYSSVSYFYLLAMGRLTQINRGAFSMAILNITGGILGGILGGGLGCVIAFAVAITFGSLLFIMDVNREGIGTCAPLARGLYWGASGLTFSFCFVAIYILNQQVDEYTAKSVWFISGLCSIFSLCVHGIAFWASRESVMLSEDPMLSLEHR